MSRQIEHNMSETKLLKLGIDKVQLVTYTALLLLSLIPLAALFSPWMLEPIPTFHQEWLALTCGLLAALAVVPLCWRHSCIRVPFSIILPVGLVCYLMLQSELLPQVITPHAQTAMLYLLWCAVLMLTVAQLRQDLSFDICAYWLATGLALAAAISGLREFVWRLSGEQGWWGGLAQANNYGDLLALGGVSLLLVYRPEQGIWRWFGRLVAVAIVIGLSLTPSRTVWLYWLMVIAVCWLYQPQCLRGLMAALTLYLALQWLWSFDLLPQQSYQSAAERLVQTAGGASLRLHIWQVALLLIGESPLLGHGFGQFDWAYFHAGQHIPELIQRMEHGHNIVLHLLVELGLLPTLFLLLYLFSWFGQLAAKPFERRLQPSLLWLLLTLAVLGIHSMLEYPLWYAQFLGIAAVLLSLGESRIWRVPMPRFFVPGLVLLLLFALSVSLRYRTQYMDMELSLLVASKAPSKKRYQNLIEVGQRIPDQAPLLTPYVPVIFTYGAQPGDKELRKDLLALSDAAYHFWPTRDLTYRLALMQGLDKQKETALKTLQKAMNAYPDGVDRLVSDINALGMDDRQTVAFLREQAETLLTGKESDEKI